MSVILSAAEGPLAVPTVILSVAKNLAMLILSSASRPMRLLLGRDRHSL